MYMTGLQGLQCISLHALRELLFMILPMSACGSCGCS